MIIEVFAVRVVIGYLTTYLSLIFIAGAGNKSQRLDCAYVQSNEILVATQRAATKSQFGDCVNTPAKLKQRQLVGEIMDQPGLDQQRHFEALRGLTRINRISRVSSVMWEPIERLARTTGRPLRILDLATGAGDLPVSLWQLGQRAGLSLNIAACDKSPDALQYARDAARRVHAQVNFFELDLVEDDIPGEFDVILCSLFLHHLETLSVVELLRKIGNRVGQLLIVSDLRRSYGGYLLACLATRVLTRSHMVHVDGPLSVRAAFTISELHDMARQAGLVDVQLSRTWPCRFLLTWKRP